MHRVRHFLLDIFNRFAFVNKYMLLQLQKFVLSIRVQFGSIGFFVRILSLRII